MRRTTTVLAALVGGLLASGGPAAAQKQPLTILRAIDADRYDPIRTGAIAAAEVVYMLADTLVSVDFDLKTIKPLLATSWTISPDGKTYTFKLRQDVKFCDGRAMKAEDVVYSLRRWSDRVNPTPNGFRAGPVKEIRAEGDDTVVYELTEPYSDLLIQLALSFSSVVDKASVESLGQNFGVQGFNGTGPYCWVGWTPRQELRLKKNPHYTWGPSIYKNGAPQIDEIVWKIIPESSTLLAALQSRQADISYYVPPIALGTIDKVPGMKVSKQPNVVNDVFIGLRVDKPATNDVDLRRAVVSAVNREAITKAVMFGTGTPLNSVLNPNIRDFDQASAALLPKYDPATAVAILDKAGWKLGADGVREKDGQKASILLYGIRNDLNSRVVEAVQSDLRKVGIEMKIQLFDATVAWGKLATQEFGAFVLSYPAVTANEALNLFFSSRQIPTPNRMNWRDETTDALLKTSSTATDDAKRVEATAAAQRRITEASLWIPIGTLPMWVVSGDRVDGVRAHGLYNSGLYKGLDLTLKR
jgi:peptide/nickel transport system substrate-binding protein